MANAYDLRKLPRTWASDMQVVGAVASGDLRLKLLPFFPATVPTAAGTTEALCIVPADGVISAVRAVFKDALAAHDTNYAEFKLINKGQAAAGTANLLATGSGVNTTKITGGVALAAYVKYECTLTGTTADLSVTKNDVLVAQVIGNGTLANTLTLGRIHAHLLPPG